MAHPLVAEHLVARPGSQDGARVDDEESTDDPLHHLEVVLHVVVGSREVIVNADRYHVLAGPALVAEIDQLVGLAATKLETVRPKAQSNGNGRGRR